MGIDTPFFHLPYSQCGTYTTPYWMGYLCAQISDLPVRIEYRKQPIMGLQRVGDEYIMATIRDLNIYITSQLLSVNNFRLALRCYTLADLLDGSGTELQRVVFQLCRRHIHSPYNWPRSKPCKQDYQL